MTTGLVGTVEIGGTHVSAGRVDTARRRLDASGVRRTALDPAGSREELVHAIVETARAVTGDELVDWGVATPGPFDYERGVALIRGVAKLDGLYGVDLRDALARALDLVDPTRVRFLNDAQAFVLGEWWSGAARGRLRVLGVTLGTGLGSGFLDDGAIVASGPDVPPEGRLDLVPFRGHAVEDVLSSRGIGARFKAELEVAEIARRARAGDHASIAAFVSFGAALGEFLEPWIGRFAPSSVVFGGSITRAWDLFGAAFRNACPSARDAKPAEHLDEAALLGAALHATRTQSTS